MILRSRRERREAAVPVAPMADLAFLLMTLVVLAGMFSAPRGMMLRTPDARSDTATPRDDTPTLWVRIRSDGSVLVDGTPVPRSLALDAIRSRLAPYSDAVVIFGAEPRASYGNVASLVAEVLAAPGQGSVARPQVAVPTRKQLEEYQTAAGVDPFEVVR